MGTRPSLLAEGEQVPRLLLAVGRVERLDPVDAERPDQLLDLGRVGDLPVGSGDDGDSARLLDRLHRLLGGRPAARHEGLWPSTRYCSKNGPRRARAGGAGDVSPPDESASPASFTASSRVSSKPSPRSFSTISPARFTRSCSARSQAGAIASRSIQFSRHAGLPRTRAHRTSQSPEQLDPELLRRFGGLGHSSNHIVVRQRQPRSRPSQLRHDLSRRKLPVRDSGMRLKLDQHGP